MIRQFRYNITRICLTEGSFTIQKLLAEHIKTTKVIFCDDTGVEYIAEVNPKEKKLYGLHDFYSSRNLAVNDVLVLTFLGDERFRVEVINKSGTASARPSLNSSLTTPKTPLNFPSRKVVAETAYVREILTRSVEPTVHKSHSHLTEVEKFAQATGYQYRALENFAALLESNMGSQSYKVLVCTQPEWDYLSSARSEYRALVVEDITAIQVPRGLKVTLISYKTLEDILSSARIYPLTPVELKPYWQEEVWNDDVKQAIAEICAQHLGQRGTFSQVVLALADYHTNQSIKATPLVQSLQGNVPTQDVLNILNTLCQQPFMTLIKMSEEEFYLREEMPELLLHLSEYAKSLHSRISRKTTQTQTTPSLSAIRSK